MTFNFSRLGVNFPGVGSAIFDDLKISAELTARCNGFREYGIEHLFHAAFCKFPVIAETIREQGGDPEALLARLETSFASHLSYSSPVGEKLSPAGVVLELFSELQRNDLQIEDAVAVGRALLKSVISRLDRSRILTDAFLDARLGLLMPDLEGDLLDEDVIIDQISSIEELDGLPVGSLADRPYDKLGPAGRALFGNLDPARRPAKRGSEKTQGTPERARPSVSQDKGAKPQSPRAPGQPVDVAVAQALRDLSALALAGRIDPVFGRDREISHVLSVLRRRRKSSVILFGEPGVGKTAIAEGVALHLLNSPVDDDLATRPFYELSIADLVAGTMYRGDFEARMKHLVERMRSERAIIFIDEIHLLVGAGATYGKGMDGANILKPALARGELTVIGATTSSEIRIVRHDGALMRRFDTLFVREPTEGETSRILEAAGQRYLDYHGVTSTPSIYREIARVAALYSPSQHFPDKGFDLLDMACVQCVEDAAPGDGPLPALTPSHVEKAARRLGYRMPRTPDQALLVRSQTFREHLMRALPGRAGIVKQLERAHLVASCQFETQGARHAFVVAGARAKERTALVDAFARALDLDVCTLDMANFPDFSFMPHLIGGRASHAGEHAGRLVDAVDGHDEFVLVIENPDRTDALTQEFIVSALRRGSFQNGEGRVLSLGRAWVFLSVDTSRAGMHAKVGFAPQGSEDDLMAAEVARLLPPQAQEVVGSVLCLSRIEDDERTAAADTELGMIARSFLQLGIEIETDCSLAAQIATAEQLAHLDAPELVRMVRQDLRAEVIDLLLQVPDTSKLTIGFADGWFTVRPS